MTILGTSTRCGVTAPMEAGSSRKRRRRGSGLSGGRPTSGSNVVGNEKSRKRCGVSGRPPALEARRPGDRVVDKLAPNSLAAGGPLDVCGVDAGPRYCFPRGAAPEPTTCTFEKRRRRRKRLARIVAPRAPLVSISQPSARAPAPPGWQVGRSPRTPSHPKPREPLHGTDRRLQPFATRRVSLRRRPRRPRGPVIPGSCRASLHRARDSDGSLVPRRGLHGGKGKSGRYAGPP